MARQIAISFENETVRIAYVSFKRGNLVVQKTLVLKDEEFDDFLKKEKTRHFRVICNFKSFYQDILLLPPVKDKFFKNIIEAEIRKRFPELKDFSFFYVSLGEKMYEGRRMNKTFVFAVNNYELSHIIERFGRHGKIVKGIYPAAFTVLCLVNLSYGISTEPVLYVAEIGTDKIYLLVKDGNPYFIREAQSFDSGIHGVDVQSINMTVGYCRQTLKLNPSQIVFVGTACLRYEATMDLVLPAVCMEPTSSIIGSRETIMEFIIPLSALVDIKRLEAGNILPQSYRSRYRQRAILIYYTAIFIIFSIMGLVYLKMKFSEISDVKKKINSIRSEIKDMQPSIINYEQKKREIDKLMPVVNLINEMNAAPDIRKALTAISSLKKTETKNLNGVPKKSSTFWGVSIASIDITSEGSILHIKIKGNIAARNFTHMQHVYQYIIGMIKKTKGMELLSDKIDFKDYNFQIEVKYK